MQAAIENMSSTPKHNAVRALFGRGAYDDDDDDDDDE